MSKTGWADYATHGSDDQDRYAKQGSERAIERDELAQRELRQAAQYTDVQRTDVPDPSEAQLGISPCCSFFRSQNGGTKIMNSDSPTQNTRPTCEVDEAC